MLCLQQKTTWAIIHQTVSFFSVLFLSIKQWHAKLLPRFLNFLVVTERINPQILWESTHLQASIHSVKVEWSNLYRRFTRHQHLTVYDFNGNVQQKCSETWCTISCIDWCLSWKTTFLSGTCVVFCTTEIHSSFPWSRSFCQIWQNCIGWIYYWISCWIKFSLKIWQRFDKVSAIYYWTNGKYLSNIWQSFI